MKAIALPQAGQDPVLMDIPVPGIDEHEVLVRIEAIGVGSHDRWAIPSGVRFPYAIGLEAAGVIQDVGSEVTGYLQGERVMIIGMHPNGGTWAEFAAVSDQTLIPMPEALGFIDAAALPVAGITALEGIKALKLRRGNTLFVAGASGAIGTLAIQLAVLRGYRVAASASTKNHDYLRSLGVEMAVDYRDPDWVSQVRSWMPGGVDAALAILFGTGTTSLAVVRDNGRLVTISADPVSTERNIEVEQFTHHPETRVELAQLATDVALSRMRVVVEQIYPFEQGLMALEKTETRHARGKIVLTMEGVRD